MKKWMMSNWFNKLSNVVMALLIGYICLVLTRNLTVLLLLAIVIPILILKRDNEENDEDDEE